MRRLATLATLLAAASIGAGPAAAAGNVEFRNSYVVPYSEITTSCSGEQVELAGLMYHRVIIVVDERGALHASVLTRGHLTGTSSSGTHYVATFSATGAEYFAPGDVPANGTFQFPFRLVSNDGSPNLLVRDRFHITINANGEVTSFSNDTEIVCR